MTKVVHKRSVEQPEVACDGLDWMLTGREFHTVGEVKQRDRLAKSDWM